MKKLLFLVLALFFFFDLMAQVNVKKNYTAPFFQGNVKVADTLGVEGIFILGGDTIASLTEVKDSSFVKITVDTLRGLNGTTITVPDTFTVSNSTRTQILSVSPAGTDSILAVTETIISSFSCVEIQPDADYVLTSTPSIAPGEQGQIILIRNSSTAFSVDLQDESILSGSTIHLNGASGTIKPLGIMTLLYSTSTTTWSVVANPNQAAVGANADILEVRNVSGSAISAGKAVYITGFNVGQSRITIAMADADDPTKMPAIGFTATTIGNNANGEVITSGEAMGIINTSSASANDPVYVDTAAGEVVFARPNLDEIQKIGQVARVNASGTILVFGTGTSNDIPIDFSADTIRATHLQVQGNVIVDSIFATTKRNLTLGVGDTTFAVTSNVMAITGDGGGNSVDFITGAISGQYIIMIFVDANITLVDDNTHTANSIDLSAAFTSADDTAIHLVFDGTSWYEVSRSVN